MTTHILVVEDEKIVAKDLQRTLQGLGYGVPTTVATGESALEQAERLRPDLVLMDIMLRGPMDGITAAAAIRERWDIPVVYLTAHADPATLERAKITEPFGYVLKPFEERDLHTTIEMAFYKHQMDRKLRESERWLSVTLNSIGDGVIATDTAGCVTFINPVAQFLTGWNGTEALGRPLTEVFQIVNEYTRQPVEDPVAQVLSTGLSVGLANHTLLIARDGTERPIDDSGAPIQVTGGELLGAVVVFRDITERREFERTLQQQAEQLAEADRRKDDFLGMLGHELRNPLAGILNGVEVLQHLGPREGEAAEVHEVIERQAGHMRTLIDDLLDVTRITRGKISLKRESVDLVELVRQAAEDHRRTVEAAGAALRLHLPTGPVWCEGDRVRLAQVMGNLVSNAAKFTDQEGEVSVEVRAEPERRLAIVVVRDTGMGMDSRTLTEIFQPFVQADQTLDRSHGGLGLGLTLVRGLVEAHGGDVRAASEGIGRGAQFTVELPMIAAGKTREEAASGRPQTGVRRRILVIDDHRDAAFLVKRMLELAGHEVFAAHDGPRGIALACQVLPEVILCDIGLPEGVSGYDVAAAIRSEPALQQAYLVAVSGYGQVEDRQRALKAGFDRHLTKPVSASSLEALVNALP